MSFCTLPVGMHSFLLADAPKLFILGHLLITQTVAFYTTSSGYKKDFLSILDYKSIDYML